MKKVYLIILSILISSVVFSQENTESIIKTPVSLSQNYVLLEPEVDIEYWELEFFIRTTDQNGNINEEVVDIVELVGKDYYRIPSDLKNNPNAYIKVTEFNANGDVFEEIQKLNGEPDIPFENVGGGAETLGAWKCEAPRYAWEINQTGLLQNNQVYKSYFSVRTATKEVVSGNPIVVIPYYEYFSPTQYNQLVNNLGTNSLINGVEYYDFYQVSSYDISSSNYNGVNNTLTNDMISIVKLQYDPTDIKQDRNGVGITGVNYVYGIAKGLGPWGAPCGVAGESWGQTDYYTYSSFQGNSKTINWAINLINSNSESDPNNCGKPNLACAGSGSVPNVSNEFEVIDELEIEMDSIVWYDDLVEKLDNIFNTGNESWENLYYAISLTKVSGNTNEVFNFKMSEVLDEEGEINNIPINIGEGVYNIGVQFKGGGYISLLSEKTTEVSPESSSLSNFLTTTIYPNPTFENSFHIALNASKDLNIVYRLFDSNLNLIYESDINIYENETADIEVSPDVQIPTGTLVNQFIFEDGSQTSVISIKSEN